jgi:hypothetical protein
MDYTTLKWWLMGYLAMGVGITLGCIMSDVTQGEEPPGITAILVSVFLWWVHLILFTGYCIRNKD